VSWECNVDTLLMDVVDEDENLKFVISNRNIYLN
jgi:hypothetical protein